MAGGIVEYIRALLPKTIGANLTPYLLALDQCDFDKIFNHPLARIFLGHEKSDLLHDISHADFPDWAAYLSHRLQVLLRSQDAISENNADIVREKEHFLVILALAALDAFVQSNVTGPLISAQLQQCIFPPDIQNDKDLVKSLRVGLIESLIEDGAAPYRLVPFAELFSIAKVVLSSSAVTNNVAYSIWPRLRMNFIHQRLLTEDSISLQSSIQADLNIITRQFSQSSKCYTSDVLNDFELEKSTIQLHDGLDDQARKTLQQVTSRRGFQFVLTGMLGVRTKYQVKETSQLVVLARSAQHGSKPALSNEDLSSIKPATISLDDDTLLESISFSKGAKVDPKIEDETSVPSALKNSDAEKELLNSEDAIILLLTASSITNTSPAGGLTREETLPYATRVIEGGSSNWQVYTQALLVRSRIEGYKSRTVERGLLQLQALVDQVIADTTASEQPVPSTFLPKPKEGESASAQERLKYVYQLASPTRWALEAELAARWVTLGGLKTALEIYERLEMWPEVALCWAGTERDDKARQIVRRQLFHPSTEAGESVKQEGETWQGTERNPLPLEAARLFCILGDLDKDPSMYERAWDVSKQRYHRAQRSLGRYWYARKEYAKAAVAFSKAVKVKQLDHATWFAMGCALLELEQFPRAVEVFSRAVQLDNEDAESWSNLAVALLNSPAEVVPTSDAVMLEDIDTDADHSVTTKDPQRNHKAALKALKQAARLKRDNHRIWDNILTVAATIVPLPYQDIVTAQQRIIEIRGKTDGEKCVDTKLLSLLVQYLVAEPLNSSDDRNLSKPGLAHMICQLVDRDVVPLITSSAPLWRIVQSLAAWRNRPSKALEAAEKAWRVVTVQPGWETGTEPQWNAVVNATIDLVDAYRTIGPQEITEGLAAGTGAQVMKDWQFKSRSAIRGIMGKGKSSWEDTDGWQKLLDALETSK